MEYRHGGQIGGRGGHAGYDNGGFWGYNQGYCFDGGFYNRPLDFCPGYGADYGPSFAGLAMAAVVVAVLGIAYTV